MPKWQRRLIAIRLARIERRAREAKRLFWFWGQVALVCETMQVLGATADMERFDLIRLVWQLAKRATERGYGTSLFRDMERFIHERQHGQ